MMGTELADLQNLLKKPISLIAIFSILAALVLISVLALKNLGRPTWKGLVPGQSTKNEIEKKLGQPSETSLQDGKELLRYPSSNQFRKDTLVLENNQLSLVKEEVINKEKGNLKDYLQRFGKPDLEGYGPYSEAGFKVYVFAKDGVAVVANPVDGTIIQMWYFKPTTLTVFKSTIGQGISDSPPESRPDQF